MMYEPRRSNRASESTASETRAEAFQVTPRRGASPRVKLLATRIVPVAASVALLATSGAFAVSLGSSQPADAAPAPARTDDTISRDTVRTLADPQPVAEATGEATELAEADAEPAEGSEEFVGGEWASAFGTPAGVKFAQGDLVVRAQASGSATELGRVKEGDKVWITDKVEGNFRQIGFDGKIAYILNSKLGDAAPVKEEPKAAAPAKAESAPSNAKASGSKTSGSKASSGKSAAPSAPAESYNGSTNYTGKSVLGLKPKAMVVYNAVTARWSFNAIGGYRASSRSNHQYGGAIDFMLTPGKDSAKGWAVANYVTANAAAFGIDHVIFEQKIWTPYKPYWRPMENRGSITQNHYDHVHVSVKL
ncbi:MAG: SH3 domain-containing protein [Propioniciclava sp.]|uniref:SH3 domain-containing protein n=1 Tax=Propioniciclava sp. TaxID=2038686 RepID=UPI0039E4F3FF